MPKKVTIHAVHERDMKVFLKSAGWEDEIKADSFICAGCGRIMKIEDIAYIKTKRPKCLVYGDECYWATRG